MNKSESITQLATALAKFQSEIKNPKNTETNPQFRSKYAPLDVVINTVRLPLAKQGLSFMQSTASAGENIIIVTMLIHESGEWIESEALTLPAYQLKSGGAKEFNAQGAGSAITYGRRYSLSAILGISSEDDDDAQGIHGGAAASPAQTASVKDKVTAAANKAAPPPAKDAPPVVGEIPGDLQDLYMKGKGNLDGLEKWVGDQMAKGRTYDQMQMTLVAGLEKSGGNKK